MEASDYYEDLLQQFHGLQLHSPTSSRFTRFSMETTSNTTTVTVIQSPATSPTQATVSPIKSPSKFVSVNIINLNKVENVQEWLNSEYNVYIGRPVNTEEFKCVDFKWGNPYRLKDHDSREEVVDLYREHVMNNDDLLNSVGELQGKVLGCWCSPEQCHGEVLHELAGNCPVYEEDSPSSSSTSTPTDTHPRSIPVVKSVLQIGVLQIGVPPTIDTPPSIASLTRTDPSPPTSSQPTDTHRRSPPVDETVPVPSSQSETAQIGALPTIDAPPSIVSTNSSSSTSSERTDTYRRSPPRR